MTSTLCPGHILSGGRVLPPQLFLSVTLSEPGEACCASVMRDLRKTSVGKTSGGLSQPDGHDILVFLSCLSLQEGPSVPACTAGCCYRQAVMQHLWLVPCCCGIIASGFLELTPNPGQVSSEEGQGLLSYLFSNPWKLMGNMQSQLSVTVRDHLEYS